MNVPCVPFLGMSSTFSLIEPSLPCSCGASHCLASPCLLEPSSKACLGNPKLGCPIHHNNGTWCEQLSSSSLLCSCSLSLRLDSSLDALLFLLLFPPLLVFVFFTIKSPPSSWLILICSWSVYCSTCGFDWCSTCCFTNCLVGHIEVRWPMCGTWTFDMLEPLFFFLQLELFFI